MKSLYELYEQTSRPQQNLMPRADVELILSGIVDGFSRTFFATVCDLEIRAAEYVEKSKLDERSVVVAWLQKQGYLDAAKAIEAGEHE